MALGPSYLCPRGAQALALILPSRFRVPTRSRPSLSLATPQLQGVEGGRFNGPDEVLTSRTLSPRPSDHPLNQNGARFSLWSSGLCDPTSRSTVLYKTPRPERLAQAGRCGTSGIVLEPRLRLRLRLARKLKRPRPTSALLG